MATVNTPGHVLAYHECRPRGAEAMQLARSAHDRAEESVAIIGAGCRLPGATGVNQFWDMVSTGRDAVTEIPADRIDLRRWYSPEKGKPHTIRSRHGGFLNDIDHFDADFFDIAPSEAAQIDPQQRLALEVTWQAIEDAGLTTQRLAGSNTGVYLSTFDSGYWDLLRSAGTHDMHAAMGGSIGGITAGRVAYHLDLRGPLMAIESACATSLFAVHIATRALRHGEIDQAIVGGSNLLISPDLYFALSEAEMLSSVGRCQFGDQRADGYVRSEGAVVLVLKRTADAIADGDRVYATIIGTAARGDGRSGGTLTAPGKQAQETLLRAAYQDAGVSPAEVDFVEAHGPGTSTGDPVELGALAAVLGEHRPADRPCLVGSVKSNVGHLEGVAGYVGLLKAALALRHRQVPATLHATRPLDMLVAAESPLRLANATTPLAVRNRPALAGVSAFGLAGSNVHVVLAEAARTSTPDTIDDEGGHILPLSAKDDEALRELAADTADLIAAPGAPRLIDVCHSAGVRRTHHDRRAVVVGGTRADIVARLRAIAAGAPLPGAARQRTRQRAAPKVVFVFPGQGSQWRGMGCELLRTDRAFAERLLECDRAVFAELGWSLIKELVTGNDLSTMDKVQPTLWAVQVALAATWRDWGIEPDVVVGHSMGEVAAAVTSGALSVADGAAVICRRARLLATQQTSGAMWAVQLGQEAAETAIGAHAGRVCVGVVNSQHSTVLSGDSGALAEVIEPLREQGVFCSKVQVDYASHAAHVQPLCPEVERALDELRPVAATVPLYSTVLDGLVDGGALNGKYWADNLRLPVRFAAAVQSVLAEDRPVLFVEISPHPVLHSAIEDGIEAAGAEAAVVGSLRRGEPELAGMLDAVGAVYQAGCDPDWARLTEGGQFVALPDYPWQRDRFWITSASSSDATVLPVSSLPSPVRRSHSFTHQRSARRPEPGVMLATAADCASDLMRRASTLLGLSVDRVDPSISLTQLGLDSLFAGKLAYQLRSELNIPISVREIFQARSIRELGEQIHHRLPGQEYQGDRRSEIA